jgi:hypothetical protein
MWLEFIIYYNPTFQYTPGNPNVMKDALSRKPVLCRVVVEGRLCQRFHS